MSPKQVLRQGTLWEVLDGKSIDDAHLDAVPQSAEPKIFSAADMAERCARLKSEGRMPPLAEVLRIVQKAARDSK